MIKFVDEVFPLEVGVHQISLPKGAVFLSPYLEDYGNQTYSNYKLVVPYMYSSSRQMETKNIVVERISGEAANLKFLIKDKYKILGTIGTLHRGRFVVIETEYEIKPTK